MDQDTLAQLVSCPNCGAGNPPDARFCGECGRERASSTPQIGQVIAERYRIIELLGRGGMGGVYKVEHVQIGKPMAMKILHGELEGDRDTLTRFHREAEAASKLSHPNTVQVFDFGRSAGGWMYLVMEYVDGPDWGQVLEKNGAMPFETVAHLVSQIAASVHDAHEAGIVHRDLKPENIVITQGPDGDMPKVLDFGLAKLREGSRYGKVTQTGAIIGTPYYMSPEQIRGDDLDGRSDVYALGALMYMAVVGEPPFAAQSPVGVLTKHLTEAPVPPSERTPSPLTAEADAIILRAMHKDPAERYQSADELREDLLDYLASPLADSGALPRSIRTTASTPPSFIPKRKRWVWGGAAFLLFALVGAIRQWTMPLDETEPNNTEKRANKLPESERLEGYLGQRLDTDQGDVDFFSFRYNENDDKHARIEVSPIPNMDIVLEVMREGNATPLAISNSGGIGEKEIVPNLPLIEGEYTIRLSERRVEGELPTENVSDAYSIEWELIEHDEETEDENNDSLEQAEKLPMNQERRGWIGWTGDVDTYCLAENAKQFIAQVSGLEGVDLVLRVVDNTKSKSIKISANSFSAGASSSAEMYTVQFLSK